MCSYEEHIQNKTFSFLLWAWKKEEENENTKKNLKKILWASEIEKRNSTFNVDFESILWKFWVPQKKCTELETFCVVSVFLALMATQISSYFIRLDSSAKHQPKITQFPFRTFSLVRIFPSFFSLRAINLGHQTASCNMIECSFEWIYWDFFILGATVGEGNRTFP